MSRWTRHKWFLERGPGFVLVQVQGRNEPHRGLRYSIFDRQEIRGIVRLLSDTLDWRISMAERTIKICDDAIGHAVEIFNHNVLSEGLNAGPFFDD